MIGLYQLSSQLVLANSREEICRIFSSALQKVLKFDTFALLLKHENELRIVETVGIYEPSAPLKLDGKKGITVACARKKKTIYVPDVSKDPRYIEAAKGIKSEIAVPILYGNELIGVIDVEKAEIDGFNEEDKKLLEIFANMLSAAFKNVEFKKKLENSEEKYRVLAEQSTDGIFLAVGYKVVYANSSLLEILGVGSFDELKKKNLFDFLHPEDAEKIKDDVRKALKGDFSKKRYEVRARRMDGKEIFLDLSMAKVMYEGKPHALGVVRDITERKRMEEALKESEEKYRILVEQSHDAIYIYHGNKFLFVNNRVAEITGYSKEELYNMDVWNLIHPDDRERVRKIARKRAKGEEAPPRYEARVITKEGSTRYCEFAVTAITYKGKKAFMGAVRDITEQKMAEEALRKSEEKYRKLFEEMKDALYISTVDGRFIDANKAMIELLGYDNKEELLKIDIEKDFYYKPGKRKEILEMIEKNGYIKDYEVEIKRKDGKKLIVLETSHVRKDKNGNVVGYEGVLRDITEKKKMEEDLRKSEAKYKSIFENAVEGIYRLDRNGKIVEANRALEEFFGYSEEELKNMDLKQLYKNPEEREHFLDKLKKDGFLKHYEIEYVRKDGKIVIGNEYAVLVKEGDEEFIDGIIHDITELKKAQQEAEFYHALLRHDVANKLQLIIGYLEMLLEEKLEGEQAEFAELAMKSAMTASKIIENVRKLQMLKKDIGRKKVDVDAMVHRIIDEYGKDAEERGIKIEYKDYGEKIMANEFLREVLSNIIWNAIIHSKADKVKIDIKDEGKGVKIFIMDNGIGISDEMKKKIFDMGTKGKNSKGSGLGLYLARKLVESMGGKIKVRDGKKKGTIFEIYLPQ